MSDFIYDEFHGKGGSYIVDPKTGKRKLAAEATGYAAEPAAEPAEAPQAAQNTNEPEGGA